MGAEAKKRALGRFTADRIVPLYLECYRQALADS
jgi:hypothetical protein